MGLFLKCDDLWISMAYSTFATFRRELFHLSENPDVLKPLLEHSDCDGQLSPTECEGMMKELSSVQLTCPRERTYLIDDFAYLLDDFVELCEKSIETGEPIIFE